MLGFINGLRAIKMIKEQIQQQSQRLIFFQCTACTQFYKIKGGDGSERPPLPPPPPPPTHTNTQTDILNLLKYEHIIYIFEVRDLEISNM